MAAGPTVRHATIDDVPSILMILAAYDDEGPASADIAGPYVRHVVSSGMAFVSELNGEVVAYGAAIDTGISVHLADLFVRPGLLGQGVGRRLLEAALGGAATRTTFASNDPRALPLYVKAGMAPLWPTLYLEGDARLLPVGEPSLVVEPADSADLAALEFAWTGANRAADHRFFVSQVGAEALVVRDDNEPVAFAYVRASERGSGRTLDRLLVRPDAEPLEATIAAVRVAGRDGRLAVPVPGPNPILALLLAARFRITDRDEFMASAGSLVDPTRLLPNPGLL